MTDRSMIITPLESWVSHKIGSARRPLSRVDLEAYQLENLRRTLALVRARSPFYRSLFSGLPQEIFSLDDLRQFPFTSHEDLRYSPLKFVCSSQDEIQRVVTLQSSGTTGEPKRIYFTAADQEMTVDFFLHGMSTLVAPGDRVLILLPGKKPGSVGDLLRIGLERLGAVPLPYGPVYDPQDALECMHNRQADCLVGSPTQVLGLALRWRPGMQKPRSVLLSTDDVPAAIVKTLEHVWGCEVYNHYGATEMGLGGGVECAAHRGYHLREADLYFEVVNPHTGEPLPDGEYGEVVFTTLTRRGMPLIRYRMGDRSRFIPGGCPCGTTLKTLEPVRGRFLGFIPVGDETLRLPDLDEALFAIPGLLNFSVMLFGDELKPSLLVEAQMLTAQDAAGQVEDALRTVPSLQNLDMIVRSRHAPGETGSLHKRAILDRRGHNP